MDQMPRSKWLCLALVVADSGYYGAVIPSAPSPPFAPWSQMLGCWRCTWHRCLCMWVRVKMKQIGSIFDRGWLCTFLFIFYPVISRFSEHLPTSNKKVMVPPVIVFRKFYIFSLPTPDSMLRYLTSSSTNFYPHDLEGAHTVSPHNCITGVSPAIDTSRPHSLSYHVYTLDPHPQDLRELRVAPSWLYYWTWWPGQVKQASDNCNLGH